MPTHDADDSNSDLRPQVHKTLILLMLVQDLVGGRDTHSVDQQTSLDEQSHDGETLRQDGNHPYRERGLASVLALLFPLHLVV
jgi:hypothetical protein